MDQTTGLSARWVRGGLILYEESMTIVLQMFAAMEPKVTIKQYPKSPSVRILINNTSIFSNCQEVTKDFNCSSQSSFDKSR